MTAPAGPVPAPESDAAELPYRWWVCLGHAAYYTDEPPARCPLCGGPIMPEDDAAVQYSLFAPLDNLTMRPRTDAEMCVDCGHYKKDHDSRGVCQADGCGYAPCKECEP